ncbi:DUF4489 domain-containing protein [Wukongibacter baidiensis]|uniref:DUF4489 domain-containing protein n=1 Tax=Wukongibacter baidiensis TaxID=1723361 RepID=UPI003D7FCBAF
MTKNKADQYNKACEVVNNFAKCKSKHPEPQKVILECGEGRGSRTFTSTNYMPFQIARVRVDTTCLNKSKVLIKFSSLVKAEPTALGIIRLEYELFRSCNGRKPLSLGTWIFEKDTRILLAINSIEESFNFIFCEYQPCSDCCDYFVTVSPIEITGAGSVATVSNGRIAALTQSLCDYKSNKFSKDALKHKDFESEKIVMVCGNGTGVNQALISNPSDIQIPISLANVTIDTSCLSRSKVLVEFSSIVKTSFQSFRKILLQFELLRVCGGSEPISCGVWRFEEDNTAIITTEQKERGFSFIFCESLNTSECCSYFVEVTPLEISKGEGLTAWGIYNTQINAYVQPLKNDCIQYCDYNKIEDEGNCAICNPVHSKPKKILLECGYSNGSKTFTSPSDASFQLAHVSIDTTSLCKPMVNIQFSSILSIASESQVGASVVQLRYELFRSIDGGTPISIALWTVDRVRLLLDRTTETFDFTYCDLAVCPGCCDYFVTVRPVELYLTTNFAYAITTVSNGRMAALAQEG